MCTHCVQLKARLQQQLPGSGPTRREELLREIERAEQNIKLWEGMVEDWQEYLSANQQQLGYEQEGMLLVFKRISTGSPTPFSPTPVSPTNGIIFQFRLLVQNLPDMNLHDNFDDYNYTRLQVAYKHSLHRVC